jgi:hypothetical protein
MSFYAKMATVAKDLLEDFGQAVTITRVTGSTRDPVTGATTAGTSTDYTPNGVLKAYKSNLIDGSRILTTDRELTLDDTIEPLITDTITVGGESWTPISVGSNNPAGTPLIYAVQVRR